MVILVVNGEITRRMRRCLSMGYFYFSTVNFTENDRGGDVERDSMRAVTYVPQNMPDVRKNKKCKIENESCRMRARSSRRFHDDDAPNMP